LCIPERAATPYGDCTPILPDGTRISLFNYQVLPGQPGEQVLAYLRVNYQSLPWSRHKSALAPHFPTLIPVRHPLNLDDENPSCGDSIEAAAAYYTDGGFTDWEVNARNILAELHGVISSQEEWALRDAIGVAYNPYNRLQWNQRVNSDQIDSTMIYHPRPGIKDSLLGILLAPGSGGQYAVGNYSAGSYLKGLNPGLNESVAMPQKVYEFSLIVAYGVSKRYFEDTSYGAVSFVHRPDSYGPTGPAYFYKRPEQFGYAPNARSSAELAESGGWPDEWEWRQK
jgi:hypothetical protein